MKKVIISILIAKACCTSYASMCQERDSVFLYNGQVLIGDIKSVDLGIITIDDLDINLVAVKLYKIKTIKASHQFRIETDDKKIYFGTLKPGKQNGQVIVESNTGESELIPIININTLVFLERKFFKRLDGNVGAGFSYTKSNGIGQVNVNSSISYVTKVFENEFKASTIGSIDSSKYSRDNESVEIFSNYNFNTTWSIAGLLAYQRNLELSLNRRFQELIGAGHKLIVRKNMQLLGISGISFNQEKSTDGTRSGVLIEIPVMARFNFYNFQHPNIQVTTSQSVYFGLTEKGRVRYSGSTDFSWELIKNFSFTLSLYNNFDSKPPESSTSKTDFGMVIGIAYKF